MADRDVIIIGGGPGGMSALIWCHSLGLSATLLEKQPEAGGQMLSMYHRVIDYPGLIAENGRHLRDHFISHINELGLDLRAGSPIDSLDLEALTINTHDETLTARAIIIATGARKRRLGIKGEDEFEGRGVSFSATRDHLAFAGREVVVIGGGDSAVENSLILARVCPRVTLIHRSGRFRSRPEWLAAARAHPRIEIITGFEAREIRGAKEVNEILIADPASGDERTIATSGVFVRIGIAPNSEMFAGRIATDGEGYILVDRTQQTSLPSVYAAGDVTRPVVLSVASAVGQGAAAAKAIAARLRSQSVGFSGGGTEA